MLQILHIDAIDFTFQLLIILQRVKNKKYRSVF